MTLEENYCSDVPYRLLVDEGYKSNGFVQGIIDAVPATAITSATDPTNPISAFHLGNVPVPLTEFQCVN